jgi:hypothetical protein
VTVVVAIVPARGIGPVAGKAEIAVRERAPAQTGTPG